jgi:hypothetical protein
MNLRIYFKLCLILLLMNGVTISFAAAPIPPSTTSHFLVLSDIHFDPFSACRHIGSDSCPLIQALTKAKPSAWANLLKQYETSDTFYRHEDSNYALLHTTLIAAQQASKAQHTQFVLILGDMLTHDLRSSYQTYSGDHSQEGYDLFVKKMVMFLVDELHHAFPGQDVYLLQGNHDHAREGYVVDTEAAFYEALSTPWATLIKNKANRESMLRTFPQGGYYAVDLPHQPHIRLMMLNSILFSNHARGKAMQQMVTQELNWLQQELEMAKEKNQMIWIAMHVPQFRNVYSANGLPLLHLESLWYAPDRVRFDNELRLFSDRIAVLFAGHLHTHWCDAIATQGGSMLVVGVPSVSPINGNDPMFQIYQYESQQGRLKAVTNYVYPFTGGHVFLDEVCQRRD